MRQLILVLAVFTGVAASFAQTTRTATHLVPTGKGWAVSVPMDHAEFAPDIVKTGNGILYHGGPVMHGSPVHAYFIWYGNWTNGPKTSDHEDTVNLIHTLFGPTHGMGGSSYFKITTTYGDATGNASGNLDELASVTNSYSRGKQLTDADVQVVVLHAISSGLPKDGNAIYFVLTSSDVAETSGFCTRYCGWHNHVNLEGTDIKYAFVGNPDRCPSACEAQSQSPNGDSGADGMVSIMSHEAVETVIDPDLNA